MTAGRSRHAEGQALDLPYVAGRSAEQLQRPGLARRLLDSLRTDNPGNAPAAGRTTTADLPLPQLIAPRPSLMVGAVVPGATGAPRLPSRNTGAWTDGETPNDFDLPEVL